MLGDVMKMAMALMVMSVLTVGAMQNHWFGQLAGLTPPQQQQPQAPAAAPPSGYPARQASPPTSRWGVVELTPDQQAQFHAPVEINGARIDALVDTGASHVYLKAEDARLLNVDPPASAYTARSETANGVAMSAPVRLREVRVGGIVVYDVEAFVAQPGATNSTLLGMSFLKRLSGFQVADGRFVMKQ
jgi:aspartyl protease family protein